MRRTIAYVDGFNLYNGLMDERNRVPGDNSPTPLRKYLWLNLDGLVRSYVPKDCDLVRLHYFTAPIRNKPDSKKRQQMYLKALGTLPNTRFHYGRFKENDDGSFTEKQTDVKIALQMYCDARDEDVQCLVLISGDTDQVPTIEHIHELGRPIVLYAIFPPYRCPNELADLIPNHFHLRYKQLRRHQFPDLIKRGTAPDIARPAEWT
jgi:hypothetical protein